MTNVLFHLQERNGSKRFCFSSAGHAGYGPKGADIVCASLSILCATLAYSAGLAQEAGKLLDLQVTMEGGKAEVIAEPAPKCENEIAREFQTILNGYRLLADNYPDYVHLDESGFQT